MNKKVLFVVLILGVSLILSVSLLNAQKKTVFRYTDWGNVDRYNAIKKPAVDAFMKAHPDIEVKFEAVPGGGAQSYNEKVVTDIAAGTPPDVFMLDLGQVPKFVEANSVLNVMPFLKRSTVKGATLADFDEHIMDIWTLEGDFLPSFPNNNTLIVMFYNKTLFDKSGVPYPDPIDWTWDEYMVMAKKLTIDENGDGKPDQYGTHFQNWLPGFIPFIWMNGGDVVSMDGKKALGVLDTAETVEAIAFLTDLRKKGYAPRTEAVDSLGGAWGAFGSGRVATWFNGTWNTFGFQQAGTYDSTGVAFMPHPLGKKRATVTYGTGFSVARNAKDKRLAAELANYMAGPISAKINAESGGVISALKAYRKEVPDFISQFAAEQFDYALPTLGLRTRFWKPLIETEVENAIERILLQNQPIEEALNVAAKKIEAGMK